MKAFLASLGMFTKIKVKNNVFENNSGPDILCWFPFDGLICGIFSAFVYALLKHFDVSAIVVAAVMLFSLFFVSGFLHLDGFMDCADSLLSARDRETKIRILKDSTVGAFSVIAVCLLLISDFAFLFEIYDKAVSILVFLFIPFVSRCMFSLVLFTFKPLDTKGLLHYFNEGKKPKHIVISSFWFVAALILSYFINLRFALLLLADCVFMFLISKKVENVFGGINGDVIGGGIIAFECIAYFLTAMFL